MVIRKWNLSTHFRVRVPGGHEWVERLAVARLKADTAGRDDVVGGLSRLRDLDRVLSLGARTGSTGS